MKTSKEDKILKKIYLAGSCSAEMRTNLVHLAQHLRNNLFQNFEVYCPFELKIPNAWDLSQEEWAMEVYLADVAAIRECDYFLMVTPGRNSTAGTNWEQGYAYGIQKPVIVAQYTNDNTSLMTYWGCDHFRNYSGFADLLENILGQINDYQQGVESTKCSTILT
jgi:nucleoside 2-deoxyribosyltransferase